MTFYPSDGQRFLDAMDLLRGTSIKRIRLPADQRLGITVIFENGPTVATSSVRVHPDGKTFCWIGEHGEYREALDKVHAVQVWRL